MLKMRLIINIKKIMLIIDPNYDDNKYIQINYKGYNHGHIFWFYDKTFTIRFKNKWYYIEYYKYISLGDVRYQLKN